MSTKGVILCGGLATRLLPITKSVPKEMMPIVNRPAIDYCVSDLKNNGITEILVIIGRNKESIENYYDKNVELEDKLAITGKQSLLSQQKELYSGLNISFIRQIETQGTGFAVSRAESFVGNDDFVLMFPDEIILSDSFTSQLLKAKDTFGGNILPLKKIDISECHKYGMVSFREGFDCEISGIIEKPKPSECPTPFCYTGGGLFDNTIFKYLRNCPIHENGEIYLTDAFQPMCKIGALHGVVIEGTRIDLGSPLGLIEGNVLAGLRDENIGTDLKKFIISVSDTLKDATK